MFSIVFGHWKESGPWKVRKFCLPKPAQIQSNLCWTARLLLQEVWKIARFVAASLLLRYNTETCKVQLFCFACLPLFCWIFVTVVLRGSASSICDPSVCLVSKLCLNVCFFKNKYISQPSYKKLPNCSQAEVFFWSCPKLPCMKHQVRDL